jgi:hypothetical protein
MQIALCDASNDEILSLQDNGRQVVLPDGRTLAGPISVPLTTSVGVFRAVQPRPVSPLQQAADDVLTVSGDVVYVGSAVADRSLAECQAVLQAEILARFEVQAEALVAGEYGPTERETWPIQREEAKAYAADGATPFLDSIRRDGEDRATQIAAVAAKVAEYEAATGALLKAKRTLSAAVDAAASVQDCSDLQAAIAANWLA